MKKVVCLFVALAAVVPAQALVIDDFSMDSSDFQVVAPNLIGSDYRVGSMFGGSAYHQLDILNNPDGNAARLRTNTTNQVLALSSQDSVEAAANIAYGVNADVSYRDLNADFTAYDRFRVTFRSVDVNSVLRVFVVDAETGYSAFNSAVNIAAGTTGPVDILFSDFGSFDFADLDAFSFSIEGGSSADISITKFEAVPEPATLAVLGFGIAALRRRHRVTS